MNREEWGALFGGVDFTIRPIQAWPGDFTKDRKSHRFSRKSSWGGRSHGVDWNKTLDLLTKEISNLGGKNAVLQLAITDDDLRRDGMPRANAQPEHPGVILTFESRFGPLSYPCDTYRDWKANVRAIAVSLEALRAVDRHGVSKRGEQYTGWNALPPAGGSTAAMSSVVAADLLAEYSDEEAVQVLTNKEAFLRSYLQARKRSHPDVGGTNRAFQAVQEAKDVLERHHGISLRRKP